jgi:hypothetical protein
MAADDDLSPTNVLLAFKADLQAAKIVHDGGVRPSWDLRVEQAANNMGHARPSSPALRARPEGGPPATERPGGGQRPPPGREDCATTASAAPGQRGGAIPLEVCVLWKCWVMFVASILFEI